MHPWPYTETHQISTVGSTVSAEWKLAREVDSTLAVSSKKIEAYFSPQGFLYRETTSFERLSSCGKVLTTSKRTPCIPRLTDFHRTSRPPLLLVPVPPAETTLHTSPWCASLPLPWTAPRGARSTGRSRCYVGRFDLLRPHHSLFLWNHEVFAMLLLARVRGAFWHVKKSIV